MFVEDSPKHEDPSVEDLVIDFKALEKIVNAVSSGLITVAQAISYETTVHMLLTHAPTVARISKERKELLDNANDALKRLEQFAHRKFPINEEFKYLLVLELDEHTPGGESIFVGGGKRKPGEIGEPYEPGVYRYWDAYLYGYADWGPHDERIESLDERKLTNEQLKKFTNMAQSLSQ